jgi:hypothetical protein
MMILVHSQCSPYVLMIIVNEALSQGEDVLLSWLAVSMPCEVTGIYDRTASCTPESCSSFHPHCTVVITESYACTEGGSAKTGTCQGTDPGILTPSTNRAQWLLLSEFSYTTGSLNLQNSMLVPSNHRDLE